MNIDSYRLRLLLTGLLLACSMRTGRAAEPPLNFVFILADDLGQRDLGCYGSTFYETPNLDALAASGMRFISAYSACQVCSPTRASIQTGKYPARLQTTNYFGGPQPEEALQMPRFKHKPLLPPAYLEQLPLQETTIAEALRDSGYATFFAGKWHLGGPKFGPERQGYDVVDGTPPKLFHTPFLNPQDDQGPPAEHIDLRLASAAARFIAEHRQQPFFVYLPLFEVHVPLNATDELRTKYEQKARAQRAAEPHFGREGASDVRLVQNHAVYAGMVETMDATVGRVLDALQSAGVADRTVVIFTSDNGGLSTAEGSPTSNVPLRGGKGWMYEGGVRVPLIVRWPGRTQPGASCDSYLISTDYYPTILDMAGLPPRAAQHIDGKSFVPLLQGQQDNDRGPIFWHYPHYGNQGGSPASAVRDGDWKLIEFLEDDRVELYNLVRDPGEHQNLAGSETDRVARMTRQLHEWRTAVGAQMPTPNPHAGKQPTDVKPIN